MKSISRQRIALLLLAAIAVIAMLYWYASQHARGADAGSTVTSTSSTAWQTYWDIELASETHTPVTDRLLKSDIKVGNVITVPSKVISEANPGDIYVNLRIVSVRHIANVNPHVDHIAFKACDFTLSNGGILSCGIYILNNSDQLALLHSTYSATILNKDEDMTQQLDRILTDAIKRDALNSSEESPINITIKAYPYIYSDIVTADGTSRSESRLEGYDVDHLPTSAPYSTPPEAKLLAVKGVGVTVDLEEGEPGWDHLQYVSLYTQDKRAHTVTLEVQYATSTSQSRILYATSDKIGSVALSEKELTSINNSSPHHPQINISYDLPSLSHMIDLQIDTAMYTFNFDTETLTRKN
ncbi:MAG: hypothetical protein JWN90_41 [Parcubacteria group bacterium]|nr:hypothetical protein [Parcubacteria group bacterium]